MIPRQTLAVTRFSGSSNVDGSGNVTPAGTSGFNITASVQPLRPNEMLLLPEGRRESESYRLYSDTQLLPAEKGKKNADTVSIYGNDFEVLSCAVWQNTIINHYKIVVVKITG